jgi:hypothetical protein
MSASSAASRSDRYFAVHSSDLSTAPSRESATAGAARAAGARRKAAAALVANLAPQRTAGMRALYSITRSDFQRLADLRIQEAQGLLGLGHTAGTYYLGGYAVECALKACICAITRPDHFPPPVDVARELYSHNLEQLLSHARLKAVLEEDPDSALRANRRLVKDWSEQSRYNTNPV